jgi:hypothetical protein
VEEAGQVADEDRQLLELVARQSQLRQVCSWPKQNNTVIIIIIIIINNNNNIITTTTTT